MPGLSPAAGLPAAVGVCLPSRCSDGWYPSSALVPPLHYGGSASSVLPTSRACLLHASTRPRSPFASAWTSIERSSRCRRCLISLVCCRLGVVWCLVVPWFYLTWRPRWGGCHVVGVPVNTNCLHHHDNGYEDSFD